MSATGTPANEWKMRVLRPRFGLTSDVDQWSIKLGLRSSELDWLGWNYGNLLDLGIWNFGLDMETMCKNEDVDCGCGAENPQARTG